ncbi:MAG: hypothetical protein A2068_03930 [Ignavibacteria bacterium GWB2_35_6b]|nr:MAG: hypothetical protein A2068_03930 [Ignavibacteria bacterium GWB2_35_6b]
MLVKAVFFIITQLKKDIKVFVLIKNKKIEFVKNLFLLLLVLNFSASSFFVKSMTKETCCHKQVEEVKPMPCCQSEMPKVSLHKCSIDFRTLSDITTNCGCFHNAQSAKQSFQVTKVHDFPKAQITDELTVESTNQNIVNKLSNYRIIASYESPPIYLIDSSFLI